MEQGNTIENNRDGYLKSPWQAALLSKKKNSLPDMDVVYDVLIVGAGITGITAALMLQKKGKKCVLVDAHTIGYGTTGGTSAHINTFADTTFHEAEDAFGEKGAQLFADAIKEGYAIIRNNIEALKIECDFEAKEGYLYAEDDKQMKELQKIYESAVKNNVSVNFSKNVPIPIPYQEALVFPEQAQFHPVKYILSVADAFIANGGAIIEDFTVQDISKEGEYFLAACNGITVKAKNVFYATHIPPGVTLFSARCAPYRSYVLGVSLTDNNYPDALVYDMQDPYHYFRTHKIDNKQYLIVGGNDHKTGHDDPSKAFNDLEQYVRQHFQVSEIAFRWSSQYYVPVDGLPYIGLMPSESNIYCATGFNGNGMMLGSIAAEIVADIILGNSNQYSDILSPSRLKPIAGFKEFVKENADVAYQLIASQFSATEVESLKNMRKNTGDVISINGKRIAVFKDKDNQIHALSPVCPHAGCIVNWNDEEKSWDCPCHGARYDIDGNFLNGPTQQHLKKVDLEKLLQT